MSDGFDVIRFKGSPAEVDAQWHVQRAKGVGGSDVAAIMGLNRYRTPLDVWLEKTGRSEPEDISGKPAVKVGNWLEPQLRREFRARHPGWSVVEPHAMYRSRGHPCMQASLDGVVHDPADGPGVRSVLEIKTVGESRARDWEDGVPAYYLTQVTHYLAVTGWRRAYVFALVGNREFLEFTVDRDEEDIRTVIQACESFWEGFVLKDVMPELTGGDVGKVWPDPEQGVEPVEDGAFANLVSDYLAWRDDEQVAKWHKEDLADRLKVMVGSREGLTDGRYRVTYRHRSKPAHMVAASSYRQLDVREIKGDK